MTELTEYAGLLAEIKERIGSAQARAVLAVNSELVSLYWQIGQLLDARQAQEGWGAGVIPRLSRDLHNELPEQKGYSERNIKLMLQFYRAYPALFSGAPQIGQPPVAPGARTTLALQPPPIGQPVVAQLPWAHNVLLLQAVKDEATRGWYAEQTLHNGWSRNVLRAQIDSQAHARQGRLTSNFATRLPSPQSDLVQQALKDPYIFDFLTLEEPFHERELETGLVRHLEKFLLEW